MLTTILLATAILGAGLLAARVLRKMSAATRHFVLATSIAMAAVAPLLPLLRPALPHSPVAIEIPMTVVHVTAAAETSAPADWRIVILSLWLGGSAFFALRLIVSWRRMRKRLVAETPMTFGLLHPVILLPAASSQWDDGLRRSVLAHEQAHIARRDTWTALLAEIVCSAYWFLPLSWLSARRLREEREAACDDAVLRAGIDSCLYAEHLVAVVRKLNTPAIPAVAMADHPHLEKRIMSILDTTISRGPASRFVKTLTFASCAAALLVGVTAQEVPPGILKVEIHDASGARVPNVSLSLQDDRRRLETAIQSNAAGEAKFDSLPPGDYMLEVRAPGFNPVLHKVTLEPSVGTPLSLRLNAVQASPDTTPSASSSKRLRIGGNVQAAKLIEKVGPLYPREGKEKRIQGRVELQAVILRDGTIGSLEVLSAPDELFIAPTLEAVRGWKYETTHLNGQPVEVVTLIHVNYTLAP